MTTTGTADDVVYIGMPTANVWMQAMGQRYGREGVRFDLAVPSAESVSFRVIATVLARVPRFGGHTRGPLSVAQHCVEGARAIMRDHDRRDWAAAFLLHDAHEAYIGDITSPVRDALVFHAGTAGDVVRRAIADLKGSIDRAIYEAAGIKWPLPAKTRAIIAEYDLRMLRTERGERMNVPPVPWVQAVEDALPLTGCDLSRWDENRARDYYDDAVAEYLPNSC